MKLKKYRAATMAEAMQAIRAELGPDAVIMQSQQVRKRKGFFGLFSKKVYEVLAGYDETPQVTFSNAAKAAGMPRRVMEPQMPARKSTADDAPTPAQAAAVAAVAAAQAAQNASSSPRKDRTGELMESIDELKGLVQQLERKTTTTSDPTPEKRFSRDVMDMYRVMVANGTEAGTADAICAKAEEVVQLRGAEARDVVKNIAQETIGQPRLIEPVKYQRRVVMLVGPTGVGKTTTLIKLAYRLVYQKNVNIGIINTDSFRVAAQDHMKAYCDILKTDMKTVYQPEEITAALDSFKDKDVVLIDTVGKVSDDEEYRADIRKMIELGDIDDVYITLSASTSDRVLKRTIENYSFLGRYGIIVTKTDEAPAPGVFLYLASLSGQPVSYMTTGQMVPDDIRDVDAEKIAEAIVQPESV